LALYYASIGVVCFGSGIRALLGRVKLTWQSLFVLFLTLSPVICFGIVERASNFDLFGMTLKNCVFNCALYFFLEVGFILFFRRQTTALSVMYLLSFMAGTASHFLLEFKGEPLMVTDVLGFYTGLNVASKYAYVMDYRLSEALAVAMLGIACCIFFKEDDAFIRLKFSWIIRKVVAVVFLAFVCLLLQIEFKSNPRSLWPNAATAWRKDGFLNSFMAHFNRSPFTKPSGYSDDIVRFALSNVEPEVSSSDVKPNIIVVMNESFSDLTALGSFENTSLEFLHEIEEDEGTLESGKMYVSVRGGGTANTEFEFLSRCSVKNMGDGIPYVQWDFDWVPAIPRQLKQSGYSLIAFHPQWNENWNRDNVYYAMGYDVFYSEIDFEEIDRIATRPTDAWDYGTLLELLSGSEKPAFIFNVTMQNHGGYSLDSFKDNEVVSVPDEFSSCSDFIAYQTLVKMSDDALRGLIEKLREVDEPVILCFFGDHQPSLDKTFENTLISRGEITNDIERNEKRYAVPYFIWANYDVGEKVSGQQKTSPNFLASTLMQHAGLPLSQYDEYLLALKKRIPVINSLGYLGNDGVWHGYDEDNGYSQLLSEYAKMNYAVMHRAFKIGVDSFI